MRDTSQLSMVFVGCGGTFFMGVPYFKVLVQRCDPRQVLFVDPDKVRGKNLDRQWPYKDLRGEYKAWLAAQEFGRCSIMDAACGPFLACGVWVESEKDALVVVNVDNDEARLEVREWAKNRPGWSGMVVSGCEANYGQAYWGAWEDGVAIHDWGELHPDVGRDEGTEHRCAPQTAEANAMTGVLAGLALADLLAVYQTGVHPTMVREYYWSVDALSRTKSWTMEIVRRGEVV